jgi:alpha-1,6-mannosyltransferase
VTIHFTTYPLQTGASLFTFLHSSPISSPAIPFHPGAVWEYDKSEDSALITPGGAEEASVDWDVLVTEDWKTWVGKGWKVAETIEGLEGFGRGGKWGVKVKWGEKIGVLVRD